jgi:hypothetical protein
MLGRMFLCLRPYPTRPLRDATVDLWSSSLPLFSLLSAPHDLEVVLMSEPSSLPALLPPRLWSHRTGAMDWEEAAAWEETRATTAWDGGNLGGDGAVA